MIEIRQETFEDTSFLYTWFETYYPDKFDQDIDRPMTWWLAYDGNEPVGVCAAEQRTKHIWNLRASMVRPEYRGQGIYRRLFDTRLAWVIAQKPLIITVISSPDNRQMFLDEGFSPQVWYPYTEMFDEILFYKEYEYPSNKQ